MKNIRPFLVTGMTSVRLAMQQLDANGQKILFVVDADDVLVGSLTDGDIRRWILAGGSLDAKVVEVCNPRPYAVGEHFSGEQVRKMSLDGGFDSVPVVTTSKKIVDILLREEIFGELPLVVPRTSLSIPVVIMAGGQGTRLAPFTHILPKPLIPIGDKTILELIIDRFQAFNVKKFYLTVHHKARIIRSYFEELKPPYTIEYLEEVRPLGTAGSLILLKGVSAERFLVTNCDIIVDADFTELDSFHINNKNDITLVASLKSYSIPYGVCELENGGRLRGISEKPEYTFLVNTGMYILNLAMLELIPPGEVFHMTDLIGKAKASGAQIGVYPISEKAWKDTGEWDEYRKALQALKA